LNFPNVLQYTVTGLVTGLAYNVKLQALNFNGASLASNEESFIICSTPSSFSDLYLVASTANSITLGWKSPLSDGGCPIIQYKLYRDNADNMGTVIQITPADFYLLPTLR